MKNKIFCGVFIIFVFFIGTYSMPCAGKDYKNVDHYTSQSIKQYMTKFGTLMSGIEILKIKEKHPDWEAIDLTLTEMSQTLSEMQAADDTNAYKPYTDVLAAGLADLKKMSRRKDKNIYDAFGKLTQTCFGCHAVHRPSDFLIPKGKQTAHSSE